MKPLPPNTVFPNTVFPNAVCWLALLVLFCGLPKRADAETTLLNGSTVIRSRTASLTDYLVNRLRATTDDQRSYVLEVCRLVDQNRLEKRLILSLERYARRKNSSFPLPVFERALRVEAAKRGVPVPMIREIVARNGASAARAVRDSRIR